jgi:molybdate transport system substrate-binding protein
MLPGVLLAAVLAACAGRAAAPESPLPAAAPTEVRIAAAADLTHALAEVLDLVAEETPDLRPVVTYGSSGTFAHQIANGAPVDLYLSADVDLPAGLVEQGLAAPEDLFPYATGALVLWVAEGSPVDPDDGLEALTDARVRHVAVANPEHAPYGRAAVSALASAGVLTAVEPRLVRGENVAQAAEFVRSGNADAGIVALALVLPEAVRDVGRWAEVPQSLHPPIRQAGVVLAAARNPEGAHAVRAALTSAEGQAVLARHGFRGAEG